VLCTKSASYEGTAATTFRVLRANLTTFRLSILIFVRIEELMTVTANSVIIRAVTACSFEEDYRRFGVMYCLHTQGLRIIRKRKKNAKEQSKISA
jgi:hypothetical protein